MHIITVTRKTTAKPQVIWELWANMETRTQWDNSDEWMRYCGRSPLPSQTLLPLGRTHLNRFFVLRWCGKTGRWLWSACHRVAIAMDPVSFLRCRLPWFPFASIDIDHQRFSLLCYDAVSLAVLFSLLLELISLRIPWEWSHQEGA